MVHQLADTMTEAVQPEIFVGDAVERVGLVQEGEQRIGECLLQSFLRPKGTAVALVVEIAHRHRKQQGIFFVVKLFCNILLIGFLVIMFVVLEPMGLGLYRLFPLTPDQRHDENQGQTEGYYLFRAMEHFTL